MAGRSQAREEGEDGRKGNGPHACECNITTQRATHIGVGAPKRSYVRDGRPNGPMCATAGPPHNNNNKRPDRQQVS